MAQRNQLGRSLCRLNAGDARDGEHVALLDRVRPHGLQRGRAHRDGAFGDRTTLGWRFAADVHHARGTARVHM
jgi:hypothetical protein